MSLIAHLLNTPVGPLELEASETGLRRVQFLDLAPERPATARGREPASGHLRDALEQLAEYFEGTRRQFELSLQLSGSDFECEIWQKLLDIPFGALRTYGELARELGGVERSRAVGQAVGSNPLAIVVPCHRVVGADGDLVGFGGGLARKRALLELEGALGDPNQLDLFGRGD